MIIRICSCGEEITEKGCPKCRRRAAIVWRARRRLKAQREADRRRRREAHGTHHWDAMTRACSVCHIGERDYANSPFGLGPYCSEGI